MSLFRRDQGTGGVEDDFATHLLAQDVIYVGGGNVVSMLGAWRAHGLDEILRSDLETTTPTGFAEEWTIARSTA